MVLVGTLNEVNMNLNEILASMPDTEKVIVTHSGGLDSSTAVILAAHKYGAENVFSVGYDYGQKQRVELERATQLCEKIGVHREVLDLSILGQIAKPMSANIFGTDVDMPTIQDVLGEPQPKTYVPYRNMILFSLTAAYAEAMGAEYVFAGIQATDAYGYWDTTPSFAEAMNAAMGMNRNCPVKLVAPFNTLTKDEEIALLQELGQEHLYEYTLTCYDPDSDGRSCGRCPSCAERIKAFMDRGMRDPVEYQLEIPWNV